MLYLAIRVQRTRGCSFPLRERTLYSRFFNLNSILTELGRSAFKPFKFKFNQIVANSHTCHVSYFGNTAPQDMEAFNEVQVHFLAQIRTKSRLNGYGLEHVNVVCGLKCFGFQINLPLEVSSM